MAQMASNPMSTKEIIESIEEQIELELQYLKDLTDPSKLPSATFANVPKLLDLLRCYNTSFAYLEELRKTRSKLPDSM